MVLHKGALMPPWPSRTWVAQIPSMKICEPSNLWQKHSLLGTQRFECRRRRNTNASTLEETWRLVPLMLLVNHRDARLEDFSSLQGLPRSCSVTFSWNRTWKSPCKTPWNFGWDFAVLFPQERTLESARNLSRHISRHFHQTLCSWDQILCGFHSADVCPWDLSTGAFLSRAIARNYRFGGSALAPGLVMIAWLLWFTTHWPAAEQQTPPAHAPK